MNVTDNMFTPGELVAVGPRGAGKMSHRDGPYEMMVPAGTLVLLLTEQLPSPMHMNMRKYVDCLTLVDGSVCWLQVVSLVRLP